MQTMSEKLGGGKKQDEAEASSQGLGLN
jgi:hypothetical protein